MTASPANEFSLTTLKPDLTNLPALNLLASSRSHSPGSSWPRPWLTKSKIHGAISLARFHLRAVNRRRLHCRNSRGAVAPANKEINVVSGFLKAIRAGADNVSPTLGWIAALCAALYTIGNLGSVGAWLIGPARVAFVIGLDRYFPKAFGAVHPRWHTPYVAILVQAALATIFLLLSVVGKGTNVRTSI